MRRRIVSVALVTVLLVAMVPAAASAEVPFTETSVTSSLSYDSQSPVTSGRYVAYESQNLTAMAGDPFEWNVWVKDLASNTATMVTEYDDGDQMDPAISEQRLVFVDQSEADSEVWYYDMRIDQRVRLTTNTIDDVGPDIDGQIAIWMEGIATPRYIRWRNVVTGASGTVPGTSHPNGIHVDKGRIVYWDDKDATGRWGVYVYNVEGGEQQVRLAPAGTDICDTVIHGDYVAWTEYLHASTDDKNIWAGDLRDGQTGQITSNANTQQYPSVFDQYVAWQDDRNANEDILLWARWDIFGYSEVTVGAGNQLYPQAWGNRIVWQDERSATSSIYMAATSIDATRVSGADRYSTAVEISKEHFLDCANVVIATGADFPDALAASGLSGAMECPLLLVGKDALPAVVSAEIDRLNASIVTIVGGTGAVSANVQTALDALPGVTTVERLQGANRYATAKQVAYRVMDIRNNDDAWAAEAYFVRGDSFADALAVSPLAYARKIPILLVQTNDVPQDTVDAIAFCNLIAGTVVGGTSAISNATQTEIGDRIEANGGWPTAARISGADRYATSVACAQVGVNDGWLDFDMIGVATGGSFADALGGGAACGYAGGPIVLTSTTGVPTAISTFFNGNQYGFGSMEVYGGTGAISSASYDSIKALLK
ncbi:MAG: cell wall-binding repeat-containing protein [Coriobacteriia bacterium]